MSVRIQNPLGILSSDVATGNLVWVDFFNGVDALAARGRLTIPFRTLTAAKNAAISGDTIIVLPGTYNEKDLLKNGVNWHFLNGAKVDYSGASDGGIFDTGGSAIASSITGYGEFINSATGTNSNVVLVTTGGSGLNLQIQGKRMASTKCCIKINVSSGIVGIDMAQDIRSTAERAIQNLGSSESITIKANLIRSESGAAVYVGAGGMHITAHLLEGVGATTDAAVLIAGSGTGSTSIRAFEIYSSSNPAARWSATAATKVTIIGARLKSGGTGSNGRSVDINASGASDNVRLHSCVLLASTAGTPGDYSLYASSSGTRVHLLVSCAGNKVEHSNVTKIGGTLYVDSNIA